MLSKIDLSEQQRDEVTLAIVAAFNRNRHLFLADMEGAMKDCTLWRDKVVASDFLRNVSDEYIVRVRAMVYMLFDLGIIDSEELSSMSRETVEYSQQQRRKYYSIIWDEEIKKNG